MCIYCIIYKINNYTIKNEAILIISFSSSAASNSSLSLAHRNTHLADTKRNNPWGELVEKAPIESRYITWCQKCQKKIKQNQEEEKNQTLSVHEHTNKHIQNERNQRSRRNGFYEQNNVSEIWRRWKRGMKYFLAATCSKRSKAEKVAIFMCMIGMMVRKSKILLSLTEQKTDQRSSQQKFYLRNSKPSVNRKRISSIAIDFSPEINSLASQ